jgi:hypothetical protein
MLGDEFGELVKEATNDRLIECLGALGIEARGGKEADGGVPFKEAVHPIPARLLFLWMETLGACADCFFAQRDTSLAEVLDPFEEYMLRRGADEMLGLSSLSGRFVNISEASMESRVRNAKVAGSLLDVWFPAILLLSKKLLAGVLDLLFPVIPRDTRWHATRRARRQQTR